MKALEDIRKDAEILTETEMEALKGGQANDMAVASSCSQCCDKSNGGIQQKEDALQ
jgi:hypothetical protein